MINSFRKKVIGLYDSFPIPSTASVPKMTFRCITRKGLQGHTVSLDNKKFPSSIKGHYQQKEKASHRIKYLQIIYLTRFNIQNIHRIPTTQKQKANNLI
jgi:hypothetical protein